jgi:hypothetical protein
MAYQKLTIRLTSNTALLQHNGQTSDPLNPFSKALKAISSKRSKTEADHAEMAKIEWYSSIYANKQKQIILPDYVLDATFVAGARKSKLGKQAQAAMFVDGSALLEFDGDKLTLDELWDRDENRDARAVKVGTAKIIRTRFRVDEWAANVTINFEDSLMNRSEVITAVKDAGFQVGICDMRPKYGRFDVAVV